MSDCELQEFADGCKQLLPMIAILEKVTAPSIASPPTELSLFNDLLQSMIATATKLSPEHQAYNRMLRVCRMRQDMYASTRDPEIYSCPAELFKIKQGRDSLQTIKERIESIQGKCSQFLPNGDTATFNEIIDLVNSLEKYIPHVNRLFE